MSIESCAVWIQVTGGAPSRALKGGPDERHPTAQVRVRGPRQGKGAYATGRQLALDVFDFFHLSRPSGFCEIRARESYPSPLGRDQSGAPEWSINLEVVVDVATGDPTPDIASLLRDLLAGAGLGLVKGQSLFASDRPPVDR